VWFPTGEKKRVWYLSQTSNEDTYNEFPTTKNLWQQLWRFLCNFNMPSNLCVWWNCVIILDMFCNCLLFVYLSTQELFLLASFGLITLHFHQVVPSRWQHNVVFCWEDVVCLS
jgi:hypothetical protein